MRTLGFVHSPLMIPLLRGNIYPKLMDISDWLPTILDMTDCESNLQSNLQSLDGVSHFKQIWEGDLRKSAKREILHGLDDLKVANSTNRVDPRIWPALEGRAFNTSINAAYRKIFKSFKIFFRKII